MSPMIRRHSALLIRGPGIIALLLLLLTLPGCEGSYPGGSAAGISFPEGWHFPGDEVPVKGTDGMVVSTDAYASGVGVRILKDGGNAVDAAVATSFALAVVNPEAGNIGGGGFMVIRMAGGTTASLDYREKAPLAASHDMYLNENGELTDASLVGHLSVGVPGTVAGLWEAHQRYGKLPWAELVAPALGLAEVFEIRERQASSFDEEEGNLRLFPATEAAFLPEGRPPEIGEMFYQPDLAATLGRIAAQGRDGFYAGMTADLIVEEMERGGGIITHQDLEGYEPAWREPIQFQYRGHTLISMPPSSSGGATLAAIAKILEGYDLSVMGWHSPEHIHLLAEAWKRAFADKNTYLADPDFTEMPLDRMISDAYGAERRATISMEAATPSAEVGPGLGPADDGETTHFSVVDREGNAVSVTTTINSWFGSMVTVEGAGFILNNEMDDFSGRPGYPNQFGLVQGEANAIEPGKRMLSAMTPTIVLGPDGRLFFVVGSPGGSTIITNVFQQISNIVDFGMGVRQAVNAPRVHHQHLPDRIQYEEGGLTAEVVAALEAMGHQVVWLRDYPVIGDVQAILVGPDGSLLGASDHRLGGAAIGY